MNIKEIRQAKGITRIQLEKMAGLTPRAIEPYEQGRRRQNGMSLDVAIKIADALGIHPRELLDDEE